eukprot:scaffold13015_cov132-Skeletonema_menzelii.AAC.3
MNHSANLPDIVPTFEQQYRQYLSMFDGVMKDEQALYLAKTVNVKFQVVNKQENTTFHNILTLEDNKIVKVQTKEDYDEDMLDFLLEMA